MERGGAAEPLGCVLLKRDTLDFVLMRDGGFRVALRMRCRAEAQCMTGSGVFYTNVSLNTVYKCVVVFF